MTDVIWTNRAINDVVGIALFISKESVIAAEKVIYEIFYCERLFLGEVSFDGPIFNIKDNRAFDYHYFIEGNYKIIYYRETEKVFIVRVFDTRQDPDKLKL